MPKFDMNKTNELVALFRINHAKRDAKWRDAFYNAIVDASMVTGSKQVITAPDGFPYFVLQTPEPNTQIEPFCVSHILDHCLDNGLGIVINPFQEKPDWVFRYGTLWHLKATGNLKEDYEAEQKNKEKTITIPPGSEMLVGVPSESFFPSFARNTIRSFMKKMPVFKKKEPKVLLLVVEDKGSKTHNLVFNIFPTEVASQAEFEYLLDYLLWYIPKKYAVIAINSDSEMVKSFEVF